MWLDVPVINNYVLENFLKIGHARQSLSSRRLCSSPADDRPIAFRRNRYAPHGVKKVVSFELSSSNGICQYPCLESNVVNTFMPGGIAATASRGTRVGWTGRFTNLLRPVRSTVIRGSSEFFFGTTTIGWHHVIDSPTGTFPKMFFSSIFLSCWWTDSRHLKEIVRALKWRHGIEPSTRSMCMAGLAMGRKGSSWNTSENSSISLALIASVSEKSGGSASSLSVLRNPNLDSSLWLPSKACGVWLTGLSRTRSTNIFWTLSWSVFCVSTWEDGHPSFSRPSLRHVFLLSRDVLSREKTCNVVWQAMPCRLRSTFTVPLGPRLVPFAALTFWVSLAKFQIRSGLILFRSVKVIASTSEPLSGSHLILTSAWSLYWTPISINPSARLVVRWIQRWVIFSSWSSSASWSSIERTLDLNLHIFIKWPNFPQLLHCCREAGHLSRGCFDSPQ